MTNPKHTDGKRFMSKDRMRPRYSTTYESIGMHAQAADLAAVEGNDQKAIDYLRKSGLHGLVQRLQKEPDYERLAWDVRRAFNNERILVLGNGYGGYEDFDKLVGPEFSKIGVRFSLIQLPQGDPRDDMVNGEYRRILISPTPDMNPKGAKIAMPYDTSTKRSGNSMASSIAWTAYGQNVLGIDTIAPATTEDNRGMVPFTALRYGVPYIGTAQVIQDSWPKLFSDLKERDLIKLIYSDSPDPFVDWPSDEQPKKPFYMRPFAALYELVVRKREERARRRNIERHI